MKLNKLKIVLLFSNLGLLFILNSCQPNEENIPAVDVVTEPFTIGVVYRDSLKAVETYEKFEELSFDTVYSSVDLNSKGRTRYRVEAGTFSNLEDASKKGIELVTDSLITDFEIYENGEPVNNYLRNFYFIGKYLNDRPGLFKYDIVKKKSKMVWSPWGRKIISFEKSSDLVNAFFITVFRIGNSVSFPYMQKVKIYHFNREEESVNSVEFLGKNQRIQTDWISDDTFRVIVTRLDSFSTVNIYKKTMKYLQNGTRVYYDSLEFNLLKDGYPAFPKKEIEYSSPDRQFKVITVNDSTGKKYELFSLISAANFDLNGIYGELNEIKWDTSTKHLFLSVSPVDSTNDSTSIHVFNYESGNKIVEIIRPGNNTFSYFGNLLFYDYGKGSERKIKIYDMKNLKEYDTISIRGGCGIKNLGIANMIGK